MATSCAFDSTRTMNRSTVSGDGMGVLAWLPDVGLHDARIEHDLAVEDRHETLRVLDVGGRYRVEIAVPHGQVRVLPDFDGANLLLQEHLPRGPDRHRPQRRVRVHRLGATER